MRELIHVIVTKIKTLENYIDALEKDNAELSQKLKRIKDRFGIDGS